MAADRAADIAIIRAYPRPAHLSPAPWFAAQHAREETRRPHPVLRAGSPSRRGHIGEHVTGFEQLIRSVI
ncbi:hypothetical protein [Microbacterium sp. SS28]|uniref:hypothetical protein n=1 Tax=Microbacterium sp. SS28 TaxID=2919948 RepID=UPI001FAA2E08|nr:hypothetical protein [Microbacterium sp. SS28]